jgi:hypothetical protein
MATNVSLKPKVTLKVKNSAAPFTFNKQMQIELVWSSATDLDLCLFWRTKNDEEGGVFSNEYNCNRDDLGSLTKFPFIQHMGEVKEPRPGDESVEQIKIKSIDALSELYIVVVNYGAALKGQNVSFNQHQGRIEISTDTGDIVDVPVDDQRPGHVYLVCKIENTATGKSVINKREVLSLGDAFDQIPGFSLICNS